MNFMLILVTKLQSRGMRHHMVWLIGTRADPEDQGSVFPQNVGSHLFKTTWHYNQNIMWELIAMKTSNIRSIFFYGILWKYIQVGFIFI